MSNKDITTLINDLSKDLASTGKPARPLMRTLIWLSISGLATAIFFYFIGLRSDLAPKLQAADFLREVTLLIALTTTAGYAAFLLSVPDKGGKAWFIPIPLTLFAVAVLSTIITMLTTGFTWPELRFVHCIEHAGLFVIVPAALITFMTARKGATVHPVLLMMMIALAAGSLGYICLRLSCMMDSIGHNLVYHMSPYLILGMLLGLIARRLYRW